MHALWMTYLQIEVKFSIFFCLPFFLLTPSSSIFIWTCILSQPVDLNIKSQWGLLPNTPSRENIFFSFPFYGVLFFLLYIMRLNGVFNSRWKIRKSWEIWQGNIASEGNILLPLTLNSYISTFNHGRSQGGQGTAVALYWIFFFFFPLI